VFPKLEPVLALLVQQVLELLLAFLLALVEQLVLALALEMALLLVQLVLVLLALPLGLLLVDRHSFNITSHRPSKFCLTERSGVTYSFSLNSSYSKMFTESKRLI
jgi:hypothetical protein